MAEEKKDYSCISMRFRLFDPLKLGKLWSLTCWSSLKKYLCSSECVGGNSWNSCNHTSGANNNTNGTSGANKSWLASKPQFLWRSSIWKVSKLQKHLLSVTPPSPSWPNQFVNMLAHFLLEMWFFDIQDGLKFIVMWLKKRSSKKLLIWAGFPYPLAHCCAIFLCYLGCEI